MTEQAEFRSDAELVTPLDLSLEVDTEGGADKILAAAANDGRLGQLVWDETLRMHVYLDTDGNMTPRLPVLPASTIVGAARGEARKQVMGVKIIDDMPQEVPLTSADLRILKIRSLQSLTMAQVMERLDQGLEVRKAMGGIAIE